jgi:predicted Holliday junction resolvase-like endonuclease
MTPSMALALVSAGLSIALTIAFILLGWYTYRIHAAHQGLSQDLAAEQAATAARIEQERATITAQLNQQHQQQISELKLAQRKEIEAARKDSVERSRSTIKGQIAEQLAPLLPGFPYEAKDCHFVGNPIDYVVFRGYTGMVDRGESPDDIEVVLLDIKTGEAGLRRQQQAIARAIKAGRVRFKVVRVFDNGEVKTHEWVDESKRQWTGNGAGR